MQGKGGAQRLATGMKLLMSSFKMAFIYMSVNLGGRDVRMTEHHLEGAQVSSACQHVRGKGVAHCLGTDCLANSALASHFANDLPKADAGHSLGLSGDEEKTAAFLT